MQTQLVINQQTADVLMDDFEYQSGEGTYGGTIVPGTHGTLPPEETYGITPETRGCLRLMEKFDVRDSHIIGGWATSGGNFCVIIDTGRETQLLIDTRRHALHHSGLSVLTEHSDHRDWVTVENLSHSDALWWECGVKPRLD